MPRNYVRKTNRADSYTKEELLEAVEEVKSGRMSGYQASKQFEIPRITIMCHVVGRRGNKSKSHGRSTVLSAEIEKNLVDNLHIMEKYGFVLTKRQIIDLVSAYIKKNAIKTPFKNGIPGHDWYIGFAKRNNLSLKKPQSAMCRTGLYLASGPGGGLSRGTSENDAPQGGHGSGPLWALITRCGAPTDGSGSGQPNCKNSKITQAREREEPEPAVI